MSDLDPKTLANLRATSAATISGRLFRRGLRNVLLRNVRPLGSYATPMVGPAYTLRYIAAREDLDSFGMKPDANEVQREAFEIAKMDIPVFGAAPSPPVNRVAHHALEHGRPITCGGVAVYPGDIVFGDADGVVIIPRNIADEIAAEAIEQEELESWLAKRVLGGAPLAGTFPPSAETLAEYKKSVAQGKK
jgi:regulator of RNase E activity RraA